MKHKKIWKFIAIFAIILIGISYLLADRYLIEHVEISNAVVPSQLIVSQNPDPGETSAVSSDTTASYAQLSQSNTVTSDDWNYNSGSTSISIKKVTTGSGKDTLTYFVADVTVSDATQLAGAFAKNEFGRNIIEYTSQIAESNNAIFAVNGDYYGFRDDGIVIRNGVIYRDQPVRTGLAFFQDGTMKIYDETQTSAQQLLDDGVWNTLSFGPALVQDSQIVPISDEVNVDTNFGNHPITGNQPRTGVGMVSANHFIFVVVDGRSTGYSRGASLSEFAAIFKELGCTDAYNIDGGGSSTMYFMGRVVNNPLGKNQERGTSDILYVSG